MKKNTETRVVTILPIAEWHVVRLIASKLMHNENGNLRPATGSDIIRELLLEWLAEKSLEWYPKILKEFKVQGIQNLTTGYLTDSIMMYIESADEAELEAFKKSMLDANWTETEIDKMITEARKK